MIALEELELGTKQSEPATPLVRFENVVKRFGDQEVLGPLNLEIHRCELLAIVGRSGCGKSTLLRVLAGLEAPSEGSLWIDGISSRGTNRPTRLMFQDAALLPWQTVCSNVALAASKKQDRRTIALDALRSVGLASRSEDWPSILSGGQRQRVALARAIASKAAILLLDEPLGALDALTRLEMQKLIEAIWLRERLTMVLVTHDVEEAVALADRVLVMDEGRVVSEAEINLPRPRARSSLRFVELKEELLERVTNPHIPCVL